VIVAHDNCKQDAIRVWKKMFTHFVNVRDSYNLIVPFLLYHRDEMRKKGDKQQCFSAVKNAYFSIFSCEYQFYELRDAIEGIIFYVATVKSSNFYFCGI